MNIEQSPRRGYSSDDDTDTVLFCSRCNKRCDSMEEFYTHNKTCGVVAVNQEPVAPAPSTPEQARVQSESGPWSFEKFRNIVNGHFSVGGYKDNLLQIEFTGRDSVKVSDGSQAIIMSHNGHVYVIYIPPLSELHQRLYYVLDGMNRCSTDQATLDALIEKVGHELHPVSVDSVQEKPEESEALAASIYLTLKLRQKDDRKFEVTGQLKLSENYKKDLINYFANPGHGKRTNKKRWPSNDTGRDQEPRRSGRHGSK